MAFGVLAPEVLVAGGPATDLVCTGCVDSTDIADGGVASVDPGHGAVTGSKLQADSVTGSKILDSSITRSDLQPIAHGVVVATSGGDYTSVSAALAAINPSARRRGRALILGFGSG